MKLAHTMIRVRDLDATLEFYTNLLVLLCQVADSARPGPVFGALYLCLVSPILRVDAGREILGRSS